MPEPTVSPKPEDKPAQAVTVDATALGESISKGLAKELAPILSRQPRQEEEAGSSPSVPLPPLPEEPSYDEIAEALEAGDKRKYADLMVKRDKAQRARLEREVVEPLRQQGAAAISSMARESSQALLAKLPTKYHAEVKALIKTNIEDKGAIATVDHWRRAVNMVYGDHAEEIENERVEARLRQQRENPGGLEPGQGGRPKPEPAESTTLAEEFQAPKFQQAWREKARAKGGLNEDYEVRTMNAGIKGGRLLDEKGRPVREYGVKEFLKERREMQAYAEANPSLGLDE